MIAKKRLLPILMAVLMVFAMMPMSAGTVFADDGTVYTVSIEPGESGDITGMIIQSRTIISEEDMRAGNYTQTAGCFYLGNDGKVYYKLPSRCSFTAPENKEFDCWKASFGGTFNCGTSIDMAEKGDFTITALWKEPEPDPSLTLSIPATLNIKYGDTQTPFDIQVEEAVFPKDVENFEVLFPYSSFRCTSHDGTIPFTVTTNATDGPNGYHGNKCYFAIYKEQSLPYSCQGYINITSEDWAAATPGTYTATLKVYTYLSREELYREIPLTLVVPDPATVHSVTVNNGTGSGSYVEGESVTITANAPETGKQFKEWAGTDGLTFTEGSKSSSTAKFTMPANDVSVTATYEEIPASPTELFTVTFVDGQGNTLKSETVEKGQAATAPDVPTREGFTFDGWDPEDFSNITSNLTVTAQWIENTPPPAETFTVTFKAAGGTWTDGTTADKQMTVDKGQAATAPEEPERDGYTFNGWDTDFNSVTSDVTVTATWAENPIPPQPAETFMVTFKAGGGTWTDGTTADKQMTVDKGQAATAPDVPTREGYTFNGWDPEDFSNITSNLTVTAKWKENITPPDPQPEPQPAAQTITASSFSKTYGNAAFSLGAKTNGDGSLTYRSSNTKVATVSTAGKVTIKGAGTANITISASATASYKAASKTITITVKKAANPLKMKPKTASVKYKKLKKKTQTLAVTKVIKFTKKLNDKKTYTLVSAKKGSKSFKKYFKINKTTGKVTIKKNSKMKKGTYKVKVKVKALGNTNYKASGTKTVTFKVKVK